MGDAGLMLVPARWPQLLGMSVQSGDQRGAGDKGRDRHGDRMGLGGWTEVGDMAVAGGQDGGIGDGWGDNGEGDRMGSGSVCGDRMGQRRGGQDGDRDNGDRKGTEGCAEQRVAAVRGDVQGPSLAPGTLSPMGGLGDSWGGG